MIEVNSRLQIDHEWQEFLHAHEAKCRDCYRYDDGYCLPTIGDEPMKNVDYDRDGHEVDGAEYMCDEGAPF